MKTKLEVGDRVYSLHHGKIETIYEIVSVSKTMAIDNRDQRFRREIGPTGVKRILQHSLYHFHLETDELILQLHLQEQRDQVCVQLDELKVDTVSLDQLHLTLLSDMIAKYKSLV